MMRLKMRTHVPLILASLLVLTTLDRQIVAGDGPGPSSKGPAPELIKTLEETRALLESGDQGLVARARQATDLLRAERRAPLQAAEQARDVAEHALCRFAIDEAVAAARPLLEAVVAVEERDAPGTARLARSLCLLGRTLAMDQDTVDLGVQPIERGTRLAEGLSPSPRASLACSKARAWLDWTQERREDATAGMRRAIELESQLAPESWVLVSSLTTLGQWEHDLGDIQASAKRRRRALQILESLSPESRETAWAHGHLGVSLWKLGQLDEARTHIETAEQLLEQSGASLQDLAKLHVNLGGLAMQEFDLVTARQHFEKAVELCKKDEPGGIVHAKALGNLREVLRWQGDLATAEEHGRQALEIFEEIAPESVSMGIALTGIGNLLLDGGRPGEALEYFERALELRQRIAPGSPWIAETYQNLGAVALRQDRLEDAESYFRHSLDILERTVPNSHMRIHLVSFLLDVTLRQGKLEEAEQYARRSLEDWMQALGPDNFRVGHEWRSVASVLALEGDWAGAAHAAFEAERIGRSHLRLTVPSLAEREALLYGSERPVGLDVLLTAASQGEVEAADFTARVCDAVVRARAALLDEMVSRHRSALVSDDPKVAKLAAKLRDARETLAELVVSGEHGMVPADYKESVSAARKTKEAAERALALASLDFRQERLERRATLADVLAVLPEGAALVGYVRHDRVEPRRNAQGKPHALQSVPTYFALVLRRGTPPVVRSLGDAEPIDALVTELREQIDQVQRAAGRAPRRMERTYRETGLALRRAVWEPVAEHVAGAERTFVVPDGSLSLLNFAALPAGTVKDRRYLIDEGTMVHYLSAERDLVAPRGRAGGSGLLALGAPDFDAESVFAALRSGADPGAEQTAAGEPPTATLAARLYRGPRSACGKFQELTFPSLPATARELKAIASLWRARSSDSSIAEEPQVVQLSGIEATERAFKLGAPGRRVLHVATHGFFLGGRCASALDENGDADAAENPLLLSGLVMAGANHREHAAPDEDDGILTAEEIGALDLSSVEWAVLSACNTGVGEVSDGEGIFGLRRAFQVAGARTLIMSLWPVEDEAARAWMTALYRARLWHGASTDQAVRRATLEVLEARREAGESTHPFYWAGFVAAGDWR